MENKKFATVINCMDGRVQLPVNNWLREKMGVDYVDTITEPGPIRILANNNEVNVIGSLKEKVGISVGKHGSRLIAVVGHYDCAGNPLSYEEQVPQIMNSIQTVKSWGYEVEVLGLWVDESWSVKSLA